MEANELRIGNLIRIKKGVLGKDVPKNHWIRGNIYVNSIELKSSEHTIFAEGSEAPLISIPTIEILVNNCDAEKFEPIPLTEEWLLAFGARKANLRPDGPPLYKYKDYGAPRCEAFDLDGVFLEGFEPYLIYGLIIAYKMGRWYFVSEVITWDYDQGLSAISAPMEFVHTLQNYYPAFAGKELSFINA